jgi:elongator complex protein 1
MPEMEIVGEVESGLSAAAWSPDDEQLVLVTGASTLSRDASITIH